MGHFRCRKVHMVIVLQQINVKNQGVACPGNSTQLDRAKFLMGQCLGHSGNMGYKPLSSLICCFVEEVNEQFISMFYVTNKTVTHKDVK